MHPTPTMDDPRAEVILILAPTGRDAPLAAKVLSAQGFAPILCPDLDTLTAEFDVGAGAVLLAEEALVSPRLRRLAEAIERQPPWSDIPVVVLSRADPGDGMSRSTSAATAALGNVAILDRPVRLITLVSAVRVALRARRRQYHVRALLERLERSVHDRDHFLAMLGHELRNPLAAIALSLQVIARGRGQDPDAQRRLEAIERQSRHLTRLVDDLLDVSRVTSGRMRLTLEPVDVAALVERCAVEATTLARSRGLELALAVAPLPVVVQGDAVRLEQIVQNLLTNAKKYTPSGGRVRVAVTSSEGRAVITVEDTGIGIAKEMLGRIFEPFTQEQGSLDRAQGGLGLGLSVVQGLVELHGGAVAVESEGRGRGSRFTVTLPLATRHSASAAALPEGERAAAPGASLFVVVIEDNDDIRESLELLLEMSGYRVASASDGPSGVALVLAQKPDVALVDIGLPGLDGYEVGRAARAALGARLLLVAITGYGQPEDAQRAKDAGFDAHLTKPVEIAAVEAMLAEAAKKGR
jgi:signal transduction histidine kinase/CheY-like chemotaxis protein